MNSWSHRKNWFYIWHVNPLPIALYRVAAEEFLMHSFVCRVSRIKTSKQIDIKRHTHIHTASKDTLATKQKHENKNNDKSNLLPKTELLRPPWQNKKQQTISSSAWVHKQSLSRYTIQSNEAREQHNDKSNSGTRTKHRKHNYIVNSSDATHGAIHNDVFRMKTLRMLATGHSNHYIVNVYDATHEAINN